MHKFVSEEYSKFKITDDELLDFCFKNEDSNWLYISLRVLKLKTQYNDSSIPESFLWHAINSREALSQYFEYETNSLLYAFVCRLIETRSVKIIDLSDIENHVHLACGNNKYGLSDVTGAEFLRQGYLIDDTYYLYSIFMDTSIGDANSQMPLTALLLNAVGENCKIYMRRDNNLSVPKNQVFTTASWDAQKFRGIHLNFANIETIIQKKEIIVHINLKTLDKILLAIKKDYDKNGSFFHIVVEELWNPDNIFDNTVITNLIHAKYYPTSKSFMHIDFEVIQYQTDIFIEKYNDAVGSTSIPIDKYGDQKYKIWCIEGSKISATNWSSLVYATLDEPFRDIFFEAFSL